MYSATMEPGVQQIIENILKTLGVPYKQVSRMTVAGQDIYSIETDDARTLIGGHGDTVHALDHIVKKIIEKRFDDAHRKQREDAPGSSSAEGASGAGDERIPMFLVDVNDYRTKQIKDLQAKAMMMAERARSFQYDVELSPMSAYERLIVHTTLQDSPNVKTESQGEGRNRRVVIKYSAD